MMNEIAISCFTATRNIILMATLSCLALVASADRVCAEEHPGVIIPGHNDKYSEYVKKLEAGHTDIDFREFRKSFLESRQFEAAGKQNAELSALRKTMYELMRDEKYSDLIVITKKMLSINYTDMEAHKVLQQTCKILGDSAGGNKYQDIEFGLLKSIVQNGDGKSCKTAWPVIQITEEYFILKMLGAQLKRQSVDNAGGLCDKMDVKTDEGDKTYYFDISDVVKGYKNRGIE